MDPCIVPGVDNLHDYIAVPGKIIPIFGSDYVVIAPDFTMTKEQEQHTIIVPDRHDAVLDDHESAIIAAAVAAEEGDIADIEEEVEVNEEEAKGEEMEILPPSIAAQCRKRGRPLGKSKPCQCPNCQDFPNADRHVCHFVNCGKTFTKTHHLMAHIRNHMGIRPFICPHQGCGATFIRAEELKRHYWVHEEKNRFSCQWCDKKFNRVDGFKKHVEVCPKSSGFIRALNNIVASGEPDDNGARDEIDKDRLGHD